MGSDVYFPKIYAVLSNDTTVGLCIFILGYDSGIGLSTGIAFLFGVGLSTYIHEYAIAVGLCSYIHDNSYGIGLSTYVHGYEFGTGPEHFNLAGSYGISDGM